MFHTRNTLASTLLLILLLAPPLHAQYGSITYPPNGDNQKASVSQWIGLVQVTVDYHSPDVTSPSGVDRTGQIWGRIVPYGPVKLGFGSCTECPWRAGANENTVFTVSHDVLVQGQPLPAGRYGLHMIAGEDEWTLIFSKNAESWGSFHYSQEEDALRVTTTPKPNAFHEWLTYEFTDRQPDQTTLELQWENLAVPFEISVPNVTDLYVANMRNELRNSAGFTWQAWNAAARFCLDNQTNLEEALTWAKNAVSWGPSPTTKMTLAWLEAVNGNQETARAAIDQVAEDPTSTANTMLQLGQGFLRHELPNLALATFEKSAEQYPDTWSTSYGLATAHQAQENVAEALKHAEEAMTHAQGRRQEALTQAIIDQLKN